MEVKRKPYQGVWNIIRFNWHFYIIAAIVIFSILFFQNFIPIDVQNITHWIIFLMLFSILLSLIVSYLIYDLSNLYRLSWLRDIDGGRILNINAGFDETSTIIQHLFPDQNLITCDFYNPVKHTEISIKRARKAYPPPLNSIAVDSQRLPFQNNLFDQTIAMLSAHEIRNETERTDFFKEIYRVTSLNGRVYVTEHLRDFNNFLVYNLGCFHFHSKSSWMRTFKESNLIVEKEIKTTPFITTFILKKNGLTF